MTGNPAHDQAIIDMVRKINDNHGGCTPRMIESWIKYNLGYDDPGRELRRLAEKDKLVRCSTGEYYTKKSQFAQGIGRFC
jgi:hypothetical protein